MSVLEIPASPAQQRIWSLVAAAGGEPIYQLTWEMVNEGPLDLTTLSASLLDVIARHEALRTEFHLVGDALVQRVQSPPERLDVELIELRAESQAELDLAYQAAVSRVASETLDLTQAPLVRLAVIRRPDLQGPPGKVFDTMVPVVHHIAADAWSCEIFSTELLGSYLARRAGTNPGFEPVRVQCADLCAWLASRKDEARCQEDLEFWRSALADVTQLDLHRGQPRPASPSPHGGRLDVSFDQAIADQIRQFARQRRATPFMVIYAAFSAAIGRVFGSADVAVGTNVSERTSAQAADTIGMFLDRVVLRMDAGGGATFEQLVARARDVVLTAHDHTEPGFEQVVAALAPPRVPGVVPLAQVSFNIQPAFTGQRRERAAAVQRAQQAETSDPFGLKLVDAERFYATVLHDLGLDLNDDAEFSGILEHRDGVVTRADASLVGTLTGRILTAGLASPDRPLGLIQTLEPTDLEAILAAQSGGDARPDPWHLLDLVGRWVASTPDATAVRSSDGTLTYRELAVRAGELAARLRQHGVTAEQPVLVAVDRGVTLPVALLGVLAAAGAYVPVDPQAPAGYLAEVAAGLAARVIVCTRGTTVPVPAGLTVISLAPDETGKVDETGGQPVDLARPREVDPANAAYVLLTSGSTGRPKPVVVELRNLGAYLTGALPAFSMAPGDVHLLVQNPTFDASLTTICGALASGGVLRIVPADVTMDPGLLVTAAGDPPADYLKLTPTHLAALLAGPDEERMTALRPRKAAILGGEPVPAGLADGLAARGWELIGQYGPTETTIGVLAGKLVAGSAPGWLGGPLRNVRLYVLDGDDVHVPAGCVGELCVGGDLVTRGYAGAPGATAKAFRPDPYAAKPGARMYRTGDLVRCLGDGTFVFQGRLDRQVKVRGHRVELTAIEAVLLDQPGVAQAAVAVRGGPDARRLAGYVVPASGHEITTTGLRAALAARLPDYSRPDDLVIMDALPVTRTGKLDVHSLPDPGHEPAAGEPKTGEHDGQDGPANAVEEQLAEIWRSVLGQDRVPVTADFFDLGGDSILAVKVVGEARARGIKLTMRGLLRHRTIRTVAESLPPEQQPTADQAQPSSSGTAGWAVATGTTKIAIRTAADDALARMAAYFDPSTGVARLEVADGRCQLIVDAAICDDWTAGVLASAITDPQAPLPPLPEGRAPGVTDLAATGPVGRATAGAAATVEVTDIAGQLGRREVAAVRIAASVHEGLRGPAHRAYGTDVTDLVVAAAGLTLARLSYPTAGGLAVTDVRADSAAERQAGQGAQPGQVDFGADPAGGTDAIVQEAKAALRAARAADAAKPGVDPAGGPAGPAVSVRVLDLPLEASLVSAEMPKDRPSVFVAGSEVLAAAPASGIDARVLASAVAEALTWIVEHCLEQSPVYTPADFPGAALSQAELDRLLGSLAGRGEEGSPLDHADHGDRT